MGSTSIFTTDQTWKAAQLIARHVVGPSAGTVIIEPTGIELSDDERLLLQRAFADCDRIFLEPLSGGMASACVFRVHAWLKQSLVGPRPLPFFVKIGSPEIVASEKKKYEMYAEHYIPFNLRPNLDRRRSVRTRACAILVGNFVDDAVPLRQSLRSGHGIGALFALFETSLRGFRLQPFAADPKPRQGVLAGFVKNRSRAHKISDAVIARARDFVPHIDPNALEIELCNIANKVACFFGPCHGDLHSGNVMVRGGDAILIDFTEASDGPLTADPAALEVSLMFGTDEGDDPKGVLEWRTFIDEIYGGGNSTLHPSALFEAKPGRFSWLRRSLRELRHILLGCTCSSPEEAPIVLATYLLRYARLGVEHLSDDGLKSLASDRHAYALVIADRIAKSLSAGMKGG